MGFKGIRDFLPALEAAGELVRIQQEVDWDLEAGAIMRRAAELQAPAQLFERVKDYPGCKLVGGSMASFRRVALALGLDPDTPYREMFDEYYRRFNRRIPPVEVRQAPCQEVVLTGADVDLTRLPAPMVHEGDGGRYIATWHSVVTRDPTTGVTNWGTYRQMIYNTDTLIGMVMPQSDMGKSFYNRYQARNEPMPFATVIGHDPLSNLVSAAPVNPHIPEAEVAGALNQEPIELVRCLTSDLLVPAHAEVILEGDVLPDVSVDEGPFGEYTGFRSSLRTPRTVYRIKAITHRRDPIITSACLGTPVDDNDIVSAVAWSAELRRVLEDTGIPITGVCMPPFGASQMVVVSTETPYPNIATQIFNVVFGSKAGYMYMHSLIVVDADVDPSDMNQVIHALASKCHPVYDIRVQAHSTGHPLMPFAPAHERLWSKGAKVLFDCTTPVDWSRDTEVPQVASFKEMYPPELQERVVANWERYGFPPVGGRSTRRKEMPVGS
jgi:phenylphosphate carboxylase alpha subunit